MTNPRHSVAVLALATLVSAGSAAVAADKTISTTLPDPDLLAIHNACSTTAAARVMGYVEAQACARNYLRLKLSFLPWIDEADFKDLGWAERYHVQQQGYAAYLKWQNEAEPDRTAANW